MILLSRLRLINWHHFADDLLDIQQIVGKIVPVDEPQAA